LDIDDAGLDSMDRRFLRTIMDHYKGGPVGIDTLAAALSEPRDTLEDVYEPYLIQQGLLARTARGRVVTDQAYTHLGLPLPVRKQERLF
jgi:Holliday junction DNA helicase RuvB